MLQVIATDGDQDLVRLLKKNLAHNAGRLCPARGTLSSHSSPATAPSEQPSSQAGSTQGAAGQVAAPVLRAAVLPWGDAAALAAAGLSDVRSASSCQDGGSCSSSQHRVSVDVVLLADVVYGSNPGVSRSWLAHACLLLLTGQCGWASDLTKWMPCCRAWS